MRQLIFLRRNFVQWTGLQVTSDYVRCTVQVRCTRTVLLLTHNKMNHRAYYVVPEQGVDIVLSELEFVYGAMAPEILQWERRFLKLSFS